MYKYTDWLQSASGSASQYFDRNWQVKLEHQDTKIEKNPDMLNVFSETGYAEEPEIFPSGR